MDQQGPLYSTGNHNEKEYETEYIHIFVGVTEPLCCIAEISTFYINYISIKIRLQMYIHKGC